MMNQSLWPLFNIMNNENATLGLTNYTGLPFVEPLGDLTPCWPLPNTSTGFDQHEWCGPMAALKLPCFYRGDCNVSSGNGEGVSFYWNFSSPGTVEWRVADNLAFVRAGGDGVDGLFTDEMEMFPGDGGDVYLRILGTDDADARAQQDAARDAHQLMIDGLVADGKYLWQAFQAANNIGQNNNNNTIGGFAFDAKFCSDWFTLRCDAEYMRDRAITVQFDPENVNVSIASFLIVRPEYAWLGYGAGYYTPRWNDAFRAWHPPPARSRSSSAHRQHHPSPHHTTPLPPSQYGTLVSLSASAAMAPHLASLSATGPTEQPASTATPTRARCPAIRQTRPVGSHRAPLRLRRRRRATSPCTIVPRARAPAACSSATSTQTCRSMTVSVFALPTHSVAMSTGLSQLRMGSARSGPAAVNSA